MEGKINHKIFGLEHVHHVYWVLFIQLGRKNNKDYFAKIHPSFKMRMNFLKDKTVTAAI